LFAFVMTMLGCAGTANSGTLPPPSEALGSAYPVFRVPERTDASSEKDVFQEPTGSLSLRQALALSLLRSPDLASFAWESRAREADALQAGLFPNPELKVESENFLGTGPFSDYDNAETTVTLGQLIELGGKRAKRRRVAELERDLADWDYEVRRIEVLTAVTREFVNVLEAQSRRSLAEELRNLAAKSFDAVSKRMKAGAASSVEETRAAVNASSAEVARRRADAVLATARARLASLWGSRSPTFDRVQGELGSVYAPPEFESIRQRVENNPDVARWASELAHRKAVVDLQNARRIPNVTIEGGVRRFEEVNDSALVLSLTVPFPLFDRNQGARQAARARRSRAFSEERAALARSSRDLEIAFQTLRSGYDTIVALREDVLPLAEKAYAGVHKGYLRGLFRYVDVLDAQRTLFELRDQELSGLGQFHRSAAEVERLTGTPLHLASPDLDISVEN
jgi:cobalt-zinc-cadmium efflux system outer membrane protein